MISFQNVTLGELPSHPPIPPPPARSPPPTRMPRPSGRSAATAPRRRRSPAARSHRRRGDVAPLRASPAVKFRGFQAIYGKSWKISPLVVEKWWKNRGKSPNLTISDISGKKESISCHLYNGFKGSFNFGQGQLCPPSVHSSLCQSL